MQGKYLLTSLVATLALAGCGGGGGGGSASPTPEGYSSTLNGIYVNQTDGGLLIVDSTRSQYPVFGSDLEQNLVFFADSATTAANSMTTTGLSAATPGYWAYSSTVQTNISFANNQATTSVVIDGTTYDYTLSKAADSLSLAQLEGTHTNPDDGSSWTFFGDGSFIVNGICTISGNIERKGAYFNLVDAEAVSCSDASLNGSYDTGAVVTVNYQGQLYVAGIIGNDSAIMWGDAPIAD